MSDIKIGIINSIDNSKGLTILLDGEETPTTKKYYYMASYVPMVNDRVLIQEISGTFVIMGNIINEYNLSGVARVATNAGNSARINNKTENQLSVASAISTTKINNKTESQLNVSTAGYLRNAGSGNNITFTVTYNDLYVQMGSTSFHLKP